VEHTLTWALTFAVSAGIGLLVGIERERKPTAKAGLRTFTLIALLAAALTTVVFQACKGYFNFEFGLHARGLLVAFFTEALGAP